MEKKGLSYQVKDLDVKKGVVVAYASIYNNEDADGETIEPGAFVKTVTERSKKLRVLYNHDSKLKIGIPLEVDPQDSVGLLTKTKFNLEKQLAHDAFTDIQLEKENGQDSDLSVGMLTIRRNLSNRKRITEVKLFEYSFLSFLGANPLATVMDVKSLSELSDKQIVEHMDQLTKMYNARYSDGRLKNIEAALKTLSDLPAPPEGTQDQSSAVAKHWQQWLQIKSLQNYLKS